MRHFILHRGYRHSEVQCSTDLKAADTCSAVCPLLYFIPNAESPKQDLWHRALHKHLVLYWGPDKWRCILDLCCSPVHLKSVSKRKWCRDQVGAWGWSCDHPAHSWAGSKVAVCILEYHRTLIIHWNLELPNKNSYYYGGWELCAGSPQVLPYSKPRCACTHGTSTPRQSPARHIPVMQRFHAISSTDASDISVWARCRSHLK